MRKRAWLALRGKIDEQTTESALLVKLKLIFEEKFRYDENGLPRVWKPTDDIDGVFKKATDSVSTSAFDWTDEMQVLALVPLYATIAPSDPVNAFELPSSIDHTDLEHPTFDFLSSLSLLSPSASNILSTRFRRESDAYYIEAKRSMVSSISQIPVWIYGVLVLLGWNEFVTVLRNPVYFMFLLVVGSGAYVVFQLGMVRPPILLFCAWPDET